MPGKAIICCFPNLRSSSFGDALIHLDFIMRLLINSHCPLFPFPPQEVTEAEQLTTDRPHCSALPVPVNHFPGGCGNVAPLANAPVSPSSAEDTRGMEAKRAELARWEWAGN